MLSNGFLLSERQNSLNRSWSPCKFSLGFKKKAKMAGSISKIFSRNVVLFRALQASLQEPLVSQADLEKRMKYAKTAKMWRNLFLFVCVPLLGLSTVNVLLSEKEEPPEFKPYEHLRIRRKNYPWRDGVKTLFHNPHTNALPTGYERDAK